MSLMVDVEIESTDTVVMLHIILTPETLLTNQRPLHYTAATISTTAIYTAATVSTIIAAVFTTTTASSVSASFVSASDRHPHLVNPFRTWTYYPKVPCL
jgi:hypothetical protein